MNPNGTFRAYVNKSFRKSPRIYRPENIGETDHFPFYGYDIKFKFLVGMGSWKWINFIFANFIEN